MVQKRLKELLSGIEYAGEPGEICVRDVVMDSRRVRRGSLFVCVRGRTFDGHEMAAEALRSGAAAVITERRLGLNGEIVVGDSRLANAKLCAAFFGHPEDGLTLIGVTGTNGKTTVASLIKQSLGRLGAASGLICTAGCEIGDMHLPAKFTTPEPWDIAALLAEMRSAGCKYAVIEASSQALAQLRLGGLNFACSVFTNLTRDHLDYHGGVEEYFEAKKLLFRASCRMAVNIGDAFGRRLLSEFPGEEMITYCGGAGGAAGFTAEDRRCSIAGVEFTLAAEGKRYPVRLPIPGEHTVENALAAAAALCSLGFSAAKTAEALSASSGVSGRSELLFEGGGRTVIRDFAHTGDALRRLLAGLRPLTNGRIITLFGCAGDRDRGKWRDMADAVSEYSDVAVLTSDNPRTESPDEIVGELSELYELTGKPYYAEVNRETALCWALSRQTAGDLLLLCGKGHEDYQVLDGVTVYMDEREIVREYFYMAGIADGRGTGRSKNG